MEVYSCEYMVDGQQLGFIGKSTITTTGPWNAHGLTDCTFSL